MGECTSLSDEVAALVLSLPAPARQRARSVLRRLCAFAAGHGVVEDPRHLLDYDVVEAFCVRGLRGRSPATRGTYRSVLYTLAAAVHPAPGQPATPFRGARAPAPYSPVERAELAALASAQREVAKRRSATSMLWCGVGVGLRPGELVALRGSDVVRDSPKVVVHVGGACPRIVPVASCHAAAIVDIGRNAGRDFVFRPGPASRRYKNFVNDFARHLVADPAAPRLSMGRCRASFICDHLAAGTALGELVAIAGLSEVESLARYARHVEGVTHSKAALRARASEESR